MKVNNSKGVQSTEKKKKSSSTSKAQGAAFDAMVDKIAGVDNVEAASGVAGVSSVDSVDADAAGSADYVPTDAQGRGNYMLESLEQLERDILAGHDTAALEKLKTALATQAIDADQIPERLREILDEIEMRASVEIAKMEAEKENSDQ